ncbi:hypothetical protein ACOJR9_17005 [Alteromonas sp. A081]|uniref:hypothetical protein n=1 Tax=Alteromonas sp. A081 TaxID=3410269 RepID=UPI003B9811AB
MQSVEQAIEESRAKKKAVIKKSLLGGLVFIAVIAVGGFLISMLPITSTEERHSRNENDTTSPSSSIDVNQKVFSEAQRKALQVALSKIKEQTEAMSARVSYSNRFREAATNIENKLDDAFNEYAASNYAKVELLIDEIKDDNSTLQSEFELAYTQPYEKALAAFNKNDNGTAFNLNRESLAVNPQFPLANTLQQRIDVFEQVQDAYEQARIGRIENNITKQQQAYASIVKLDPLRKDASQALAVLNKQQADAQFAAFLAQANQSIKDKNYSVASQRLADAAAIKANSKEVEVISQRLNTLIAGENLSKIEEQVAIFSRTDEWETVSLLATKGLTQFPTSTLLLQANKNAKAILESRRQIASFQQRPERLADSNIRQAAIAALQSAEPYFSKSDKLRAQAETFTKIISDVNTPRAVTITSDDDTYIKVLGVGIVGEVKTKTIQLKPGTYRIEGSREGYRSVIKNIEVTPSTTDLSVNIICTEKV